MTTFRSNTAINAAWYPSPGARPINIADPVTGSALPAGDTFEIPDELTDAFVAEYGDGRLGRLERVLDSGKAVRVAAPAEPKPAPIVQQAPNLHDPLTTFYAGDPVFLPRDAGEDNELGRRLLEALTRGAHKLTISLSGLPGNREFRVEAIGNDDKVLIAGTGTTLIAAVREQRPDGADRHVVAPV